MIVIVIPGRLLPGRAVVWALLCLYTGDLYAQKTDTLHTVVVRASPPLIRHEIDKTVFNVGNSITSAGSDVLDLMKKLPGVQVDQDGQISLNGKGAVTIFIDGKASYLSAEDLAQLLRSMSAADIQQIELMPNPSARYDAAGAGGIINIVRKKSRRAGWNGSVRGGGGISRYDKYNVGGECSYRSGAWNLNLNASYYKNEVLTGSDFTLDILGPDHRPASRQQGSLRDRNRSKGNTTTLMIDRDLSKRTSLSFSCTGTFQFVVDETRSQQVLRDSAGKMTGGLGFFDLFRSHTANYNPGIRLVHKLDTAGQELSMDLDLSSYPSRPRQLITNSQTDADGRPAGDSVSVLDRVRNLHIYVARVDYTRPLPGKARLELGLKSSYVRSSNVQLGDRSFTGENINALYLSMNKEYKLFTVQAGLRAEQTRSDGKTDPGSGWQGLVKKRYLQLFPSLFAEYRINDKDHINFQMSTRVLRPSYRLLNPLRDPLSATSAYQGDPGLKTQINRVFELGYSWRNAVTVNLGTIFYHDFFRAFNFVDSNGLTTTKMPANIKRGWGFYLQVNGSIKPRPWWTVNYSTNTYDRWFSGLVRGLSPGDRAVMTLFLETNQNFVMGDGWSGELGFKYVTARQVVSMHFGPYSNISLGIRKTLLAGKGSIALSIYNLLEKEGNTAEETTGNFRQYGYDYYYSRSLNLNFSYRFGLRPRAATRGSRSDTEEQQRTGN